MFSSTYNYLFGGSSNEEANNDSTSKSEEEMKAQISAALQKHENDAETKKDLKTKIQDIVDETMDSQKEKQKAFCQDIYQKNTPMSQVDADLFKRVAKMSLEETIAINDDNVSPIEPMKEADVEPPSIEQIKVRKVEKEIDSAIDHLKKTGETVFDVANQEQHDTIVDKHKSSFKDIYNNRTQLKSNTFSTHSFAIRSAEESMFERFKTRDEKVDEKTK